ncbi:MAG: hypothetical protein OEY44_04230 [Candidatus Peregrinibacteria bacterium]|nr:hypothetical protein [Candidatus Peregrinibacteria bacterium]
MPKPPRISSALAKAHKGETAISLLDGTVVAFGKNAVEALSRAKKSIRDIEEREFVVSRVHEGILAI